MPHPWTPKDLALPVGGVIFSAGCLGPPGHAFSSLVRTFTAYVLLWVVRHSCPQATTGGLPNWNILLMLVCWEWAQDFRTPRAPSRWRGPDSWGFLARPRSRQANQHGVGATSGKCSRPTTAVVLLAIPEMSIESLDESWISRSPLVVLNTVSRRVFSKSSLWNRKYVYAHLKYESGRNHVGWLTNVTWHLPDVAKQQTYHSHTCFMVSNVGLNWFASRGSGSGGGSITITIAITFTITITIAIAIMIYITIAISISITISISISIGISISISCISSISIESRGASPKVAAELITTSEDSVLLLLLLLLLVLLFLLLFAFVLLIVCVVWLVLFVLLTLLV